MSDKMSAKSHSHEHKELYENVFDGLSYYPSVGETYHLNRSKQKVQKYYLEAIEGIQSPKILDTGCYIGTDLFMLPKPNRKAKYFGTDISKDAIAYAKKLANLRGEKNMEFSVSDANKPLPFPKNYFDVILCLEMIEHLVDPKKFLADVMRILKPGGSLIITTPNGSRFTNKLIEFFPLPLKQIFDHAREQDFTRHGNSFHLDSHVWDHEAHISLYGYGKWKKIFAESGFLIEAVDGSSIYGGTRMVGDHPFLLGLTILVDSFIDKLPLKPLPQMCLIVKLKKIEHVV